MIMSNPELLTALGAALSIFLTSAGSSFGSVHAGVFAVHAMKHWGKKAMIPIIIAGVLAIYGIIVSVILCRKLGGDTTMTESDGYKNLCAGLSVGLACLSSGVGIGYFMKERAAIATSFHKSTNDNHGNQMEPLLRAQEVSHQLKDSTVTTVLVLVYLEAIGLYGLIIALFLSGDSGIVKASS